MTTSARRIADNLSRVQDRIARAAQSCGRQASDVTLVAVTKYAGVEAARALLQTGCRDLGESRPQELWSKAAALADPSIRWHLVGHLQRNKVQRTAPLVWLIHSVDSPRLLAALNEALAAAESPAQVDVLLEIKISPDAAKSGLSPEAVPALLDQAPRFPRVRIRGLMAMASRASGADVALGEFTRLRELRDRWEKTAPEGVSLAELSMGMSGDFEQAIRAGGTIVRIGSALFEGAEG